MFVCSWEHKSYLSLCSYWANLINIEPYIYFRTQALSSHHSSTRCGTPRILFFLPLTEFYEAVYAFYRQFTKSIDFYFLVKMSGGILPNVFRQTLKLPISFCSKFDNVFSLISSRAPSVAYPFDTHNADGKSRFFSWKSYLSFCKKYVEQFWKTVVIQNRSILFKARVLPSLKIMITWATKILSQYKSVNSTVVHIYASTPIMKSTAALIATGITSSFPG